MKRILLIAGGVIFGIIILLVVGFFSLPYILSAVDGKDEVLKDDSSLIPKKIDLKKPGNSYELLQSINFDDQNQPNTVNWFSESGPSDIDWNVAIKFLEQNLRQLNIYNQAANATYYQIPYLANPEEYNLYSDDNLTSYGDIRIASRLALINSLQLAKNNQVGLAIDQSLAVYDNCYLMANGSNNYINLLVAISQCRLAIGTLNYINTEYGFSQGQKEYIKKYLGLKQDFTKGITTAIQFEYLSAKQSIDLIKTDDLSKLSESIPTDDLTTEVPRFNPLKGQAYYFKPNQTLNDIITTSTNQLLYINNPCQFQQTWEPWNGTISIYYTENSIGKLLANVYLKASQGILERPCKLQTELNSIINS